MLVGVWNTPASDMRPIGKPLMRVARASVSVSDIGPRLSILKGCEGAMSTSTPHLSDERYVSLQAHDQYFREIRRIPRLSPAQEQLYLARLARGKEEQAQAVPNQWRLFLARDARERLVDEYQWFVVYLARQYLPYTHSLELLDLIQEGNVGLLEALDQCDYRRGTPFRTYAWSCIRHALMEALMQRDRFVRLPAYLCQFVGRARKARREIEQQGGESSSLASVAAVLNRPEEQVRTFLHLAQREHVESLQAVGERLGEKADDGSVSFVGLYEPTSETHTARSAMLHEGLRLAMQRLTPYQRAVLSLRYGLGDEVTGEYSVEEIARQLGRTEHSVRVVEIAARKRLAEMLRIMRGVEGVWCEVRAEVQSSRKPEVDSLYYTWQEAVQKLNCSSGTLTWYVRAGQVETVLPEGCKRGRGYVKASVDALAVDLATRQKRGRKPRAER
jgi:RNA polymerase primary sigma factor